MILCSPECFLRDMNFCENIAITIFCKTILELICHYETDSLVYTVGSKIFRALAIILVVFL